MAALETISHGRLVTSERSRGLRIFDPATGAVLSSDPNADREIGDERGWQHALLMPAGHALGQRCDLRCQRRNVEPRAEAAGPHPSVSGNRAMVRRTARWLGVFYAGELLRTSDLQTIYTVPYDVVLVTPDGRVATTQSNVLAVADGAVLGRYRRRVACRP